MVEPGPVIISAAFAHCSQETTKVRPNLPEEEVNMGMMVLARKRSMRWQRGKIVDIVTRGKTKCLACPPVSTGSRVCVLVISLKVTDVQHYQLSVSCHCL